MPARSDRPSNGIRALLGSLPEEPCFYYVELFDRAMRDECGVKDCQHVLVNSDAHRLEDINEPENTVKLDVTDHSDDDEVRRALIKMLRGNA